MTADHDLWEEFIVELAVEIEFRCNKKGFHSKCKPHEDRPNARKLLERFGADVPKSLAYFKKHGGFCDCEIIVNCAWNEHKRIRETSLS